MAGFLNTILSPFVAGGTVIIGPRFTAETGLDFWKRPLSEKANTIWITPSIALALARLTRDRETARGVAAQFSTILCGTSPLHPNIRKIFDEQFGAPLQESYGTSELLLVSAQNRTQASLLNMDVGSVLPELEIAFRSDVDGRNELMIRSPFAMLGYLTEDGLVLASDADGFLPTGDAGRLDDGILRITGRIKDLIIRGGINISPRTVEDVLSDLPGIEDVAVIGIPHQFWGEKLVVCVQVSADVDQRTLTGAVRQRCRERLARSCQPDQIALLPKFPRSVTGKVQKHILQRELAK
jgi:long-chain acyl-CoA synthetase